MKLYSHSLTLSFLILLCTLTISGCCKKKHTQTYPLVFMTDFGVKDGAVSAMKGVAYQVSKQLTVSDLTHEIPPYDIWQAAYRLKQTAPYWPQSVFVTVVDPGVGSERKSIVAQTKSGHYFVGPDNGHLTLIAEIDPIIEVRQIDESKMRLKGSEESYTFHGRDLYAYIGAQIASGKIKFTDVGDRLKDHVTLLSFQKASFENDILKGTIVILDSNYGNLWTNISKEMLLANFKDAKDLLVTITHSQKVVFEQRLPIGDTFAAVQKGEALIYFNSLLNLSVALNQDSFAQKYNIQSGHEWNISFSL